MDRKSAEEKLYREEHKALKQEQAKEKMAALEARYNELLLLKQELDKLFEKRRAASSAKILQSLQMQAKELKRSAPVKTGLFPQLNARPKLIKQKSEPRTRFLHMQPLPQLKTNLGRAVQEFNNSIYRVSSYQRGK